MHWMLIIICPLIHEAYFCDPMATTNRDTSFKHVLQIAFRTFRARGGSTFKAGSSLKWINIVCHQQHGSTECGYYVMRYMLDIIRHYHSIKKIKKSGLTPRMLIHGKRLTRFENYGLLTLWIITFSLY
ncbi:hypothetical protein RND81_05G028600 [Saponaria officinalis]